MTDVEFQVEAREVKDTDTHYVASVEFPHKGLSLTESDLANARTVFLERAMRDNPNGLQGEPINTGSTLVAGQSARFSFSIERVVKPVKRGK